MTIGLRILKLIVMRSGTYNPMYSRPYETHYDASIADDLAKRVANNGPGGTTTSLMAGIANRIMMPSPQHMGVIPITNGWENPRGRFSMVVEITSSTGSTFQLHIQGYTSHFDTSLVGTPDPDMLFFINSYTQISQTKILTPTGIETREIVTESAQVINGRLVSSQLNHDVYGMRPNELYTVMQHGPIAQEIFDQDNHSRIKDERHTLSRSSVPNSRSNNLPANILATMVNSYQTGQALLSYGSGQADIYSRCKGYVHEGSLSEKAFFRRLSDVTGQPDSTTFKLKHLVMIDNNVLDRSVSNFITLTSAAMTRLNHAGQSEYWHNPNDRGAWVASVLINAVPTIMMEMMILKLQFTSNNHDHMGVNHVLFTGAKDIMGRDISQSLNVFKQRFIHEVMHDLTHGNQETYMLQMSIDLLGDTVIDIQIGVDPMTRYVAPSFCDSLMAPIITTDEQLVRNNVYDFTQILQSVQQDTSPSSVNELV